jgi:hypothetical protein
MFAVSRRGIKIIACLGIVALLVGIGMIVMRRNIHGETDWPISRPLTPTEYQAILALNPILVGRSGENQEWVQPYSLSSNCIPASSLNTPPCVISAIFVYNHAKDDPFVVMGAN